MSALSLALQAYAAQSPSPPPLASTSALTIDTNVEPQDVVSVVPSLLPLPTSHYSPLPSLTSSASASTSSLPATACSTDTRTNEHLAVLLPRQLWKPDSLATTCDNFYCPVKFSMFERRHHCRKCGGIFCGACTSRNTPLLDASKLDFIHPPRNVPISTFESPESPIYSSRVCDDCWDQIHGYPSSPRTPDLVRSGSASPVSLADSLILSSPASSSPSMNLSPLVRRPLRTMPSISSLTSSTHSGCASSRPPSRHISLRSSTVPLPDALAATAAAAMEPERSYGELDAYPLRRHSTLCKRTGGGRWEPKEIPENPGYRIPGCKAPFEMEMEREEMEARRRKENPVVRDGEFQYRFQRPDEPLIMARSPFQLSTF